MRGWLVGIVCMLALVGCSNPPAGEGENLSHINVVMKKYAIEPGEIRLKKGEEVMLHISTADVQHGFDVPELGIKESVQKGRPAMIRLKPEKAGEFKVVCSVLCGAGHDDMLAKIIVE